MNESTAAVSEGAEAPATTQVQQVEVITTTVTGRDFSGELNRALGSPRSCIQTDQLQRGDTELRATINVLVSTSGRVTRAEVAGDLDDFTRRCVQRLAEEVRFRYPVEDAPRTVTTELIMQFRVTVPEGEAPESLYPQRPAGFVAPTKTLPAVGAENRPSGFVAPASSLPSVGSESRPEGTVPPEHTLPARGEPIPWQHAGR